MKYCITINIESDVPLNLLAQRLKSNAEEAVIEILSNTKANTFVDTEIHKVDDE
jgi:hypothetical protein